MKSYLLLCFLIFFLNLHSQDNNKFILLLKKNTPIVYYKQDCNKKLTGNLNNITDSNIRIDDTLELNLNNLEKISIKHKYLTVGKNISYRLHTNDIKTKGKITGISSNSISINDTLIQFIDISNIEINSLPKKVSKIIGGTIFFSGLSLTAIGISSLSTSSDNESIVYKNGFSSTCIGLISMITGSLPFLFISKKYDLGFEWNVYVLENKIDILK